MLTLVGLGWVCIMLLIIAGLIYYIHRALKQRAAIAPGWSFDRDQQPLLFWLQLCVVGWFVLHMLFRLFGGIVRIAHIIHP